MVGSALHECINAAAAATTRVSVITALLKAVRCGQLQVITLREGKIAKGRKNPRGFCALRMLRCTDVALNLTLMQAASMTVANCSQHGLIATSAIRAKALFTPSQCG